jgi:hypothetical protein
VHYPLTFYLTLPRPTPHAHVSASSTTSSLLPPGAYAASRTPALVLPPPAFSAAAAQPLRYRHRRRRAAALANATAITITMEADDSTPAQMRRGAGCCRRKTRGVGRGLSWSNEELTALIVQGYSISSDSAVGAGQTVEKNAGRMRAVFFETVRRTRAPLTRIKLSAAV